MESNTFSANASKTIQSVYYCCTYLHHGCGIWTPVIFWKVNWWNNPLPLHPSQTARHVWKLNSRELLGTHVRIIFI